jgi:hypothetical protein
VFGPDRAAWGAPRLPDSPSIRMVVWKGEVIEGYSAGRVEVQGDYG